MRSPQLVRDPSLPERVTIYEVGPRDGLQNESAVVPVETKAAFVKRLVEAGLPVVEATSSRCSTRSTPPASPTTYSRCTSTTPTARRSPTP